MSGSPILPTIGHLSGPRETARTRIARRGVLCHNTPLPPPPAQTAKPLHLGRRTPLPGESSMSAIRRSHRTVLTVSAASLLAASAPAAFAQANPPPARVTRANWELANKFSTEA